MSDLNAAEFYANPDNRSPVGPPRRPRHRQLTNHVPVRFTSGTIASIRAIAWRDGVSVSSWIRAVVEREVDRLLPLPQTAGKTPLESLGQPPLPAATLNPYSFLNKESALIRT